MEQAFTLTKELLDHPCPTPVVLLAFLCPVIIAYLVHLPGTRLLRIGTWMVGVWCWIWTILKFDLDPGE